MLQIIWALLLSILKILKSQDSSIENLKNNLNDQFPGMFFRVNKMFLGSSDSSEIKLQVVGPDSNVIYAKAQQLVDRLHEGSWHHRYKDRLAK